MKPGRVDVLAYSKFVSAAECQVGKRLGGADLEQQDVERLQSVNDRNGYRRRFRIFYRGGDLDVLAFRTR